jgi:hypothetical protein
MTITNIATGHAGAEDPGQHWQLAHTQKEAAKLGISKTEYAEAALVARTAAEEHQNLGTPRHLWEPTPTQNDHLADQFIEDGAKELAGRLDTEADPALDEAQDLVENVKANLDEIAEDREPISTPESGSNHSAAQAVERVEQHDTKIERDTAAGKHHHRRASGMLKRTGRWAPWVEAVGFLAFVAYFLNVPLLQPWQDWLGWTFAMTVVVFVILGQTWLVNHAATSHNHAREARADGNRHEAEHGFTRRNWYIAASAVAAVAITSGMILRGTTALGDDSVGTTAVMVFLATVTGLLMPTLAYLGTALDGSKVARERDSLAADLDNDHEDYNATIQTSRRDLAAVAEIRDTLNGKTLPDICNTVQEAVDGVYRLYGIVRLLIGGLSTKPPLKTTKTIGKNSEGSIHGYIGTSIPGTRNVNLGPLFDRCRRLADIEAQRSDLLRHVEALPPHPWGKSRTA